MRILCYGDSNTWGYDPVNRRRFGDRTRWTGVLQRLLGDSAVVIEEGLNGRTTVWDDPVEGNKNGLSQLPTCLSSHAPLDLVILMLGTNDLKRRFAVTAYEVMLGVQRLVETVRKHDYSPESNVPNVLVVAPASVGVLFGDFLGLFGAEAAAKAADMPPQLRAMADRNQCLFLDASCLVEPDPADGLHLSPAGHERLAEAVCETIRQWESHRTAKAS
jgi:lysophospholipase L1-like esterase